MTDELMDRDIHGKPYLNKNQLKYALTGSAPEDYAGNSSDLRDGIEGSAEAIPDRLFSLIEDITVLQTDEGFKKENWSHILDEISEGNVMHPSESDLLDSNLKINEGSYHLGIQLGHLARLLLDPVFSEDDILITNREAVLIGCTLGLFEYGFSDSALRYLEDYDDELAEKIKKDGSVYFNKAEFSAEYISEFTQEVRRCAQVSGDTVLFSMYDSIDRAGLNRSPAVMNLIYNKYRDLVEEDSNVEINEVTKHIKIEHIGELDRAETLIGHIIEDIEELLNETYSDIGDELIQANVLRAVYLSSESRTDDVYTIFNRQMSGLSNVSDDNINSAIKDFRGKGPFERYWDRNPIVTESNEPTAYGKLISKIIFPEKEIRRVDRYLPVRNKDTLYINPTSIEVRNAVEAFALDCPSTDTIDGAWKSLFEKAYNERIDR